MIRIILLLLLMIPFLLASNLSCSRCQSCTVEINYDVAKTAIDENIVREITEPTTCLNNGL